MSGPDATAGSTLIFLKKSGIDFFIKTMYTFTKDANEVKYEFNVSRKFK